MEQIRHHGRREPRGVGVDQEKQGLGREDLAAFAQEFPEAVLEFPHLAAGAATVGGGVHDDGVVAAAALDLAAHELEAVVHDVAHGGVGQAAEGGVVLAPLHHALGGVHMGDAGAGLGGGAGGGAGVAEEVEHADLAAGGAGAFDEGGGPLPVDRLLGEEAGVFKTGGLDAEGEAEAFVADGPVVGRLFFEFPATAALAAAVIKTVPAAPLGAVGFGPDDLGVGADEVHAAPAFLLHAEAAVEELIVAPAIGQQERGALDDGSGHGRSEGAGRGGVERGRAEAAGGAVAA